MSKLLSLLAITAVALLAARVEGESRLHGGKNAANGQFPHQVALRNTASTNNRPFCGGSIIGARFVLTAASCILRFPDLLTWRVIAGEVDLRVSGAEYRVDYVKAHPQAGPLRNDIGIVRIIGEFTFSTNVQAIKLPTADTPIESDGSSVTALFAGWGQYKASQSIMFSVKTNVFLIANSVPGGQLK